MTKRLLALAVFLLACASLPAQAPGGAHLSADPQIRAARGMVRSGRFREALRVLRPLVAAHPDQTDVRFLIGLAAMGASRRVRDEARKRALLDEAIASLRAILVARPELTRVRLELARAFFLKRDDDLARRHFERVLAGRPPPALAANVRRYLRVMRARRGWSARFGFAIAPDSNVNAASDAEIIWIRGLPFRWSEESRATSGTGVVLWGGVGWEHPLTDRLRLRTGADASRLDHEERRFDQTFLSLHAGPRVLVDAKTEVSLLASARLRWSGGAPYTRELGARVEAERRLARGLLVGGGASWHRRQYLKRDRLDGPVGDLFLGAVWLPRPTVRATLFAGLARERPETRLWRNESLWARGGVSLALPLGFTVGATAEVRRTKYEGDWAPLAPAGDSRADRTRILRLSVLHRAVTAFGFSPQVALVNETRASNAQLYDYRRDRLELRFVRQF